LGFKISEVGCAVHFQLKRRDAKMKKQIFSFLFLVSLRSQIWYIKSETTADEAKKQNKKKRKRKIVKKYKI
jgi:hypothetical protein